MGSYKGRRKLGLVRRHVSLAALVQPPLPGRDEVCWGSGGSRPLGRASPPANFWLALRAKSGGYFQSGI